jgi:predicted AlkP superfamily pyrophosphatase or phosphodiesterase
VSLLRRTCPRPLAWDSAKGTRALGEHPLLPDYGGACLSNVVPALLEPSVPEAEWLPEPVRDASQVVLLALDGLGWDQLQDRVDLAPHLSSMAGGPIRTVVPSTTATALTSLTTGTPPGEHGVIGYRVVVADEVLNILRWTTPAGDARQTIEPHRLQPVEPFCGHRPPVVTRAEFATSGFTAAHLSGVRFRGYRMASTLATEVSRLLRAGESFVYAYYDGVDKVAHEYGLGEHYDAEISSVDFLVGYLTSILPSGAALLVTSDHGQVDVGDRLIMPHPDVLEHVAFQSGEGRFRWLHARSGRQNALLEAAESHHDDTAWVHSRPEILDGGWFGPSVSPEAAARLGDVALVARDPVAFVDSADTGPFKLVARHGSLTSAEMLVPLLASRG